MTEKPFKFKIAHKGLLLISLPLMLELVVLASLYMMLQESEQAVKSESRAKQIVASAAHLLRDVSEMKRSLQGMATSANGFRADFDDKRASFSRDLDQLQQLATAQDLAITKSVIESATAVQLQLDDVVKLSKSATSDIVEYRLKQLDKEIAPLETTLRSRISSLSNQATGIQNRSIEQQGSARDTLKSIVLIGVLLNIAAAIGVSIFFSRTITKRLKVLNDNSFRLASRLPLHSRLTQTDEISDLDKSFHWMAKELEDLARRERAITDNAIDVLCSIDENGKFVQVNPASYAVWGFPPEELTGQRFISIIRDRDKESTLKTMQTAIELKEPVTFENGVNGKAGNSVEVMWNGTWSEKDNALFLVARDITERKRIENLKKDFVNLISHDLRTPLTSIQAFLEMLSMGMYDESLPEMRTKAKYSEVDVARLISMINSLLDLEKMEAGHIEIVTAETDVDDVLNRAISSVDALAQISKIKLIKRSCDCLINADDQALVRILVNLISNAIKFSPAGESVIVSANELDDRVEFQVTDSGRGISAENLEKVFDRFKQVELADARVKGGSGLGLAVCKALVEAHGGTIDVVSEEGKGSTFRFFIPKTNLAPLA